MEFDMEYWSILTGAVNMICSIVCAVFAYKTYKLTQQTTLCK